jgi:peptidoglycan/xylan/chitin deacetylase (PgdA/CDA1 family)
MKITALMYHDIIENGGARASGFGSADADIYKLEKGLFDEHLNAIGEISQPKLVTDFSSREENPLVITFDDGGRGAFSLAADALERRGWLGHFFVATDFIDTPTFLSRAEIKQLKNRGHIVGSHSASHPLRMSACSPEQMREEWLGSAKKLADITGEKTTIASVPGGHFSKRVAETAAEAGIEILFNSEPVRSVYSVGSCRVVGRFTVQQNTTAAQAAAFARGDFAPRFKQFAFWNAKKIAKRVGGEFYLDVRRRILSKR